MVRTPLQFNVRPTPEIMFPNEDWVLSPKAMRGYLQYRLHIIDHQIDGLMQELGQRNAPPFPSDLEDEALSDEAWTLWSRLNYLLQARDSLQAALSRPQRKLN
jgi:hypothetical protein